MNTWELEMLMGCGAVLVVALLGFLGVAKKISWVCSFIDWHMRISFDRGWVCFTGFFIIPVVVVVYLFGKILCQLVRIWSS